MTAPALRKRQTVEVLRREGVRGVPSGAIPSNSSSPCWVIASAWATFGGFHTFVRKTAVVSWSIQIRIPIFSTESLIRKNGCRVLIALWFQERDKTRLENGLKNESQYNGYAFLLKTFRIYPMLRTFFSRIIFFPFVSLLNLLPLGGRNLPVKWSDPYTSSVLSHQICISKALSFL